MSIKVLSFGEVLIDFVVQGERISWGIGGAPANLAIIASKLNVESALISAFGDDYWGNEIDSLLLDCGVQRQYVSKIKGANTSLAFIFIDQQGEQNEFLFYRDADTRIEAFPLALPNDADNNLFCFGSLSLADERLIYVLDWYLDRLHRTASLIIFDLNIRYSLWPNQHNLRQVLWKYISLANIVKANLNEARFLTEEKSVDRVAGKLWRENMDLLLITLGKDGCFYKSGKNEGFVKGLNIDTRFGDAVGAGDAFLGTFCAGLCVQHKDLRNKHFLTDDNLIVLLSRSNAAGALTAAVRGAIPTSISWNDLDRLIDSDRM